MNPYFFIFVTLGILVLTEKIESAVLRRFFGGYLDEIARAEAEIAEYHELSMLAAASGDREAFKGFQDMMSEIYTKVFFRKITFFTSLYFLLLSPYIAVCEFVGIENSTVTILILALSYFSVKLLCGMVYDFYRSWKDAKEARKVIGGRF